MAKKRTGLQSNIASIFSGVPIPKKGQPGSEPPGQAGKGDVPAVGKPPGPQPRVPAPPSPVPSAVRPAVAPIPEIAPRVVPAAAAERKVTPLPSKVPSRKKVKAAGPGAGVSPARQKVSIAMVVILSLLLVVLLGKPFGRSGPGPAAPGGTVGPAAAAAAPRANVKIDWPVPAVYPADLRDPMVSGPKEQVVVLTPDVLIVKGITYSEERKFAVIGTLTVQEGDTVEGTDIKVIKINPDSVEFEDGTGKRWTQRVQGESSSNK